MNELIVISAESSDDAGTFGGQGISVTSLIRALEREYNVRLITLGFKGQKPVERNGCVEIHRVFTDYSRYGNCKEMLDAHSGNIERIAYGFRDGVLKLISDEREKLAGSAFHIHHGWCGEGLIASGLSKMGFEKLAVTFHWNRVHRFMKEWFHPEFSKFDKHYVRLTGKQKIAVHILNRLWRDEREFIGFMEKCHKLKMDFILPKKLKFYYDSEIVPLRVAKKLVFLSEASRDYSLWLTSGGIMGRTEIIGNGVDSSYFKPPNHEVIENLMKRFGIKSDDVVLLFVGRIDPMKGVSFLVESMDGVKKRASSNVRLLITGTAAGGNVCYKKYLEELCRIPGVDVTFTGSVYGEEKTALYDMASVFVLPSIYDPFGLVALEAMARGKPVIVSSNCGCKDIVNEGFGRVVDYGEPSRIPKRLAEAIVEVMQSDITEMGKSARDEARKHTWDKVAEKYLQVYGSL